MDNVFLKTRELGEALLESDTYKRMKAAEDKAMGNETAAQLMNDLLQHRGEIQRQMQLTNPDPIVLKRLSDEVDDIQERLSMMDDITELTQARGDFNNLINQVNQVLQFIVTGRMEEEDCGGDCSACAGCH
ncbi:MAG: YlbF family regulator [Clostridia bacterium]|nr:YlbF family regulator [Clostridia bacterium]